MIISIEGNIGAGKSTILEHLKDTYKNDPNVAFVDEPVDMWSGICDTSGEDILTKFYKEPSQYAFPFQVMAFATRIHKLREAQQEKPTAKILICERSLEADCNIFAKMLYDDGLLESIQYSIYKQFYEIYCNDVTHIGIIHVDACPVKCFERIQIRNRAGEDKITQDYIHKCHKYHKAWLGKDDLKPDLLRIDTTPEKTDEIMNQWKNQIDTYLKKYI